MASELDAVGLTVRRRTGWTFGPVDAEYGCGLTALVGPNGAGKTTYLRLLAGVVQPHAGHVAYGGRPADTWKRLETLRRVTGYLPQHPSWPRGWRVAEMIDFTAASHGMKRAQRATARKTAATRFGVADLLDRPVHQLSGGQRQRAHLAAVMVHDPQVLLLDEPTVGLDPAERVNFRRLVKDTAADRIVLLSTHLMDDVALAADHVQVVRDGTIVWTGPTEELRRPGATHPVDGLSPAEAAYLHIMEQP